MALREVQLPSGNILQVDAAPFRESRRLYQAIGGEFLHVRLGGSEDLSDLIKNVLCLGASSLAIEKALEPCLKRCTYNGLKIVEETFEPVAAREDYFDICVEVTKENVGPFTKSLFAQFKVLMELTSKFPALRSSEMRNSSSPTSDSAMQATGT